MSQAKNYEMKASGVEWIGMMPSDWQIQKAKYFLTVTNGSDPVTEGEIPVYGSGSKSFRTCGEYKEGPAVLVGRKGSIDKPRYVTGRYWNVDTAFDVKTKGFDLKLYYYLATCFDYQFYMSQTTLPSMTQTNYRNMFLPVPPLPEQTAIAAYLDEKCATIDAIIAEAKATIDEYKAWKASVIFEAVTKGLNPNAEMKDSGVEWIGEIPKGWKVKAAKYCVEIHHGSDPVTEGDVPVYGSGADSFKTCGEYKEGPAVLVGRKGATLHIPHYIIGRYWNVDTAFDVKAHPDFSLKFYYYLAICFDYKFYISQTTLPGMTQTNYRNMPIPVPPLSEQASIVSYLDRKCSLIDGIILEKEDLIRELENYKRSLIFEVVTGKRRVC